MAASAKIPIVLRESFSMTTAEQAAGIESGTLDLSSIVDPISGKVIKIAGVQFLFDDGAGVAITDSDISNGITFRMGVFTGAQTSMLGDNDERTIASQSYYVKPSAADPTNFDGVGVTSIKYDINKEFGFYVATDTLTFACQFSSNVANATIRMIAVINLVRVSLSANDVNILLVNQTLTG
jgi:hypothetical protein